MASLVTQEHPQALREPSLVAKELSYWFSFLQSVRSASSQNDPKPLEVCVVLTHKDCCQGLDEQEYTSQLQEDLTQLLGTWPSAALILCINSLSPSDCDPLIGWLRKSHHHISERAAPIPRLCKELEKPLNILRGERTNKVSTCVVAVLLFHAALH